MATDREAWKRNVEEPKTHKDFVALIEEIGAKLNV
jgi:hypothetical protein